MRPTHHAGYTLIELLLAMSLFSAIATGLIALLARSSDFLTSGASQTETMDATQTFAEAFGDDISAMASRADSDTGRPDVRLFCDWAGVDINEDKRPDLNLQRLFFVRTIRNDAATEAGQSAGVAVSAKEYLNQVADAKKVADGTLKASGGLMEVFWMAMPESASDPAVMQLWRGYRAPPGGANSLLPVKGGRDAFAKNSEKGPTSPVEVRAVAKPILSGVLFFGVDFWSRRTNTWDPKVKAGEGGPIPTWDSTRGILPSSTDLDGFVFSKMSGPQDTTSLNDTTDDTFPRKIRVTCVLEELGRNARVGWLDEDLAADSKSIPCSDTRFFPASDTAQRYVKIDGEWIEVGVPSGGSIPVLRRGARGTIATAHKASARVHHGRTFVQEYDVATFRDTYRDELGASTGRGGYGK